VHEALTVKSYSATEGEDSHSRSYILGEVLRYQNTVIIRAYAMPPSPSMIPRSFSSHFHRIFIAFTSHFNLFYMYIRPATMPPKLKRVPPRRGPTRRLSRTARVECHEHTCTCEPAVTDRTCGTAHAIKHVWNATSTRARVNRLSWTARVERHMQ